MVAVSWFLGTFLPFLLLSLVWKRTSYIYYMVVVMPGLYLAVMHSAVTLAPAVGRLVARELVDGTVEPALAGCRVDRF